MENKMKNNLYNGIAHCCDICGENINEESEECETIIFLGFKAYIHKKCIEDLEIEE